MIYLSNFKHNYTGDWWPLDDQKDNSKDNSKDNHQENTDNSLKRGDKQGKNILYIIFCCNILFDFNSLFFYKKN